MLMTAPVVSSSSAAFTNGFYYVPRIDKALIETYKQDLICLTGNLYGEVPSKILNIGEKQIDVVRYIFGRLGIDDDFAELLSEEKITYLRTADEIFLSSIAEGESDQKLLLAGLECLSLVPEMNLHSRDVIIRNMNKIGGTNYYEATVSARIDSIRRKISNPADFRDGVDEYLAEHYPALALQ